MKAWRLTLRLLKRDWRSGELLVLGLALLLAVAAITAVSFFTDRIDKALQRQGGELIAADLVLDSSAALPPSFTEHAKALRLTTARTLEFPSVVLDERGPQLVQVKAVSPEYPLRGQLRVRNGPNGDEIVTTGGPAGGEIWLEPRLLLLLDTTPGEQLSLGEGKFQIGNILSYEPDRGGNLFQFAPRVLLALEDIPRTGLVTPASRVRHRLLIAGIQESVDAYQAWARSRLPPGTRILDSSQARPEFGAAVDRASRFLVLASLVTFLVAGAAIALASHRFVERQTDAVAVIRCLGAPQHLLMRVFLLRLILFGVIASALGCALGYAAQLALAATLAGWFGPQLPNPSLEPALIGLTTGMVALLGFALPPLLRLKRISPLRALRRDLGTPRPSVLLAAMGAFFALSALLFWQAEDEELALTLLPAVVGCLLMLALAALLLTRITALLQGWSRGVWRLGLASLNQRRGSTVLQLMGFGLAILALLLLAVVRLDLLNIWRQSLPAEAPNRFLINIQPHQINALEEFLNQHAIESSGLFPMIRGRLVRINEHAVKPEGYTDLRAQRLAAREFNLSWAESLQADNRVVSGTWWDGIANPNPQFSLEQGIAQTLGIKLGDRLTFVIAGQEVAAAVTSLRSVQWDSFNVNFFVIGNPKLLLDEPATYITSFFLPQTQDKLLSELLRRFSNVTLLDVDAILDQVRHVMNRGVLAVEYVFMFTLLASIVVMYAGIQASQETRLAETAILRTLGATRKQLLWAVAVEFTVIGFLAGLLASFFAELTGWLLADRLFGLEFSFNPWLWLIGITGSGLGIGTAGTLATYPFLVGPPLQTLRRTQ